MFALRKITDAGVELNFRLGGKYTVVHVEHSPKDFVEAFKHYYKDSEMTIFFSEQKDITGDMEYDKKRFWLDVPKAIGEGKSFIMSGTSLYRINGIDEVVGAHQLSDSMEGKTYAFVSTEDGSEIYPLFRNQRNYIVGENGKTFSNLTLK